MNDLIMWQGEESRELVLTPPPNCCNTCKAAWPPDALACVSASDETGRGFTLYLRSTEQVEAMRVVVGGFGDGAEFGRDTAGSSPSGMKPVRVPGHKLTVEWNREYGEERSSTGTCPCGWSESGSTQEVVRYEYRQHLRRRGSERVT